MSLARASAAKRHPPGRQAKVVLVVDDDNPYRDSLAVFLGSCDYAVHQASTCREARARVRAAPPDAVLLDLNLPDGSGLALLTELLALAPGLRVLILTALDSPSNAFHAAQRGASGFFDKLRTAPSEIAQAIERDLDDSDTLEFATSSRKREASIYLHRVKRQYGSVHKAMKVLQVDRSSLQRMLKKDTPPK